MTVRRQYIKLQEPCAEAEFNHINGIGMTESSVHVYTHPG